MIQQPGVLALLAASVVSGGLLALASLHAVAVLRRWDPSSGSAAQLALERRTWLVATLVRHALLLEVASLFLFVHVAGALAPLLAGAMCAAGTLAASPFGYPALGLRLATAVLAGLWLVLNRADELGHDAPLVRAKHGALLALAPLVLAGAWLQARHLLALEPDVITSCCGSLFGEGDGSAALASSPSRPAAAALFGAAAAAIGAALAVRRRPGRAAALALGATSALALGAGLAGVTAFVSPYVYALPGHRCPFCLLEAEYGRVGYALYGTLLAGTVAGMGAGLVAPFARIPSLATALPRLERRLAATAAAALAAFAALAAWSVLASELAA